MSSFVGLIVLRFQKHAPVVSLGKCGNAPTAKLVLDTLCAPHLRTPGVYTSWKTNRRKRN